MDEATLMSREFPNTTWITWDGNLSGYVDQLIYRAMFGNRTDNDRNQYQRDLVTYYMGIGVLVLSCFGLVGNMLSLVVLTRRSMRSSTYSYLAALAVCDSLVLIFTAILVAKDVDKPVEGKHPWPWKGIYPYIFPYIHPMAFNFQVTSIWLTLAFTVDRYIMICHPFKAEPHCTVTRARIVIVCLCLASLLFNIPKFFEYKTVTIRISDTSRVGCDLTHFGRSAIFRELLHSWFYIVFVCGVPFLALAVLNAFLMHAVRLSRLRGREINAAERKRNDTTIMLIGVVVVFFCCQMPALVSRTAWAFLDTKTFKQLPFYTLNEIGNFLIILNSSINIVPYYFFGQRFRKLFWQLFCKCILRWDKFSRISRSISLTLADNRRVSNGSVRKCMIREPDTMNTRHDCKSLSEYPGSSFRKCSDESAVQESLLCNSPYNRLSIGSEEKNWKKTHQNKLKPP